MAYRNDKIETIAKERDVTPESLVLEQLNKSVLIGKAAKALGVSYPTLRKAMDDYGIKQGTVWKAKS